MEATTSFFKMLLYFYKTFRYLGILLHFVLILHVCKEKLHLLQTDLFSGNLKKEGANMEEVYKKEIKKEFKKITKKVLQ